MTTTIEKITQLMTTTQEEDTQYLNEVIQEIKVKRKPGRPTNCTPEEAKERIRAYDRRRYRADPLKNTALAKANYLRNKESH